MTKLLEEDISNILNRNNTRIEVLFHDETMREYMKEEIFQMEKMGFTPENLSESLELIASHIFNEKEKFNQERVDVFLVYSIKIEEYFKNNEKYHRDLILKPIVNILSEINYREPRNCIIL